MRTIRAHPAAGVETSFAKGDTRDPFWGARIDKRDADVVYHGRNVPGRLWMELRQHARAGDPLARSSAWLENIRIGQLTQTDG